MWLEFETAIGTIELKRLPEYESDPISKQRFLSAWKIRAVAGLDPTMHIGSGSAVNGNLTSAFFRDGHFVQVGSEVPSTLLQMVIDLGGDLAKANVFDEADNNLVSRQLWGQISTNVQGSAMEHALKRIMKHPQLNRMSPREQQSLANSYMEEFSTVATSNLDGIVYMPFKKIVMLLIDFLNCLVCEYKSLLLAGNEVIFVVSAHETKRLLGWSANGT